MKPLPDFGGGFFQLFLQMLDKESRSLDTIKDFGQISGW